MYLPNSLPTSFCNTAGISVQTYHSANWHTVPLCGQTNTASKRTFSSFQFHTPRKSGMYSVFSLLRVINTNFEVALINIPPEDLRLHFCHCQQLVGIFSCSL